MYSVVRFYRKRSCVAQKKKQASISWHVFPCESDNLNLWLSSPMRTFILLCFVKKKTHAEVTTFQKSPCRPFKNCHTCIARNYDREQVNLANTKCLIKSWKQKQARDWTIDWRSVWHGGISVPAHAPSAHLWCVRNVPANNNAQIVSHCWNHCWKYRARPCILLYKTFFFTALYSPDRWYF